MVKRKQLRQRARKRDYLVGVRARSTRGPTTVAFDDSARIMQSYKSVVADNTTLVLSTDSDLSKFLKGMAPGGEVFLARDRGNN